MDIKYKKRNGTTGISGHLYETKFVSLLVFRLLHNEHVEDFYLASNMDEIGAFDDVCLKIIIKGTDRPLILFIQMKHREKENKCLTLNKDDFIKLSDSIQQVRQRFVSNKNHDQIFNEKFDENFVFILYTNAKNDHDSFHELKTSYAAIMNSLIATGPPASRLLYTDKDINAMSAIKLHDVIKILVNCLIKYFFAEKNLAMDIMNNEIILQYHVILAKSVVDVSEIKFDEQSPNSKWRILSFRKEFMYNTEDDTIILLRKPLFENIITYHRNNEAIQEKTTQDSENPKLDDLISSFLSKPSADTLWPLIDSYVMYENNKLSFVSKRSLLEEQKLEQINISQPMVDEAREIAVRKKLESITLKVPVTFGNVDLTIRGNQRKIEKRLKYLTNVIVRLCEKSQNIESYKIITIDDNLDDGILSSNGGLAGCVGNILVYDDKTNYLKFVDNEISLQENAKALFLNLKEQQINLSEYRFKVNTSRLPNLSLNCTHVVKEFLNKLVVYKKQSNHIEIQEILKNLIDYAQSNEQHKLRVSSDAIYQCYHNSIQSWWMSPIGEYINRAKAYNMYHQAINDIIEEPQICALQNTFYVTNTRYFEYVFTEDAMESIQSIETYSRILIVTDIVLLTTIKVVQFLRKKHSKKHAILDLKYIVNLTIRDFCALDTELTNTEKIIILPIEKNTNNNLDKILKELSQATAEKEMIVITDDELVTQHFCKLEIKLKEKTHNINDLSQESQKDILKNAQVIFQGQPIDFNLLVDDESVSYIKGAALKEIFSSKIIFLNKLDIDLQYKKIGNLYIERRVRMKEAPTDLTEKPFHSASSSNIGYGSSDEEIVTEFTEIHNFESIRPKRLVGELLKTFYDIKEDLVILTAKPGMGKSTLLTHLSIKTRELYPKQWILRINLLHHSKQFEQWIKNKIAINTLQTLKFICQVMLKNYDITINLEEINGKVFLEDCIDNEMVTFELNMFLHSYNKGRLILLFDGFDEICPDYGDHVIRFLEVVKEYPGRNKVWVTSRPYSDILPDLERVLGKIYKLEYINAAEEEIYLKTFWKSKIVFANLSDVQVDNAVSLMGIISKKLRNPTTNMDIGLQRICKHCYDYISLHFPRVDIKSHRHLLRHNTTLDKVMGIPLLLQLVADYFVNVINESANLKSEINIYNIYEMFIETKLKKILFQDKSKMDISNPNIMRICEKEVKECISVHKRIAAYSLLGSNVFGVKNNYSQYKEVLTDINKIKKDVDKSGFISHIEADIYPIYIHRTFAEYFAADYLSDFFKGDSSKTYKHLMYSSLHSAVLFRQEILLFLMYKRKLDKELDEVLNYMESEASILFFVSGLPQIRPVPTCGRRKGAKMPRRRTLGMLRIHHRRTRVWTSLKRVNLCEYQSSRERVRISLPRSPYYNTDNYWQTNVSISYSNAMLIRKETNYQS